MSKLGQIKVPVELAEITIDDCNWMLIRGRDGSTHHSLEVKWIEWNEDGTHNTSHVDVAVGRSLIMSPFNRYYTWMTTTVTEIVDQSDDYIKFNTENSSYTLTRINNG